MEIVVTVRDPRLEGLRHIAEEGTVPLYVWCWGELNGVMADRCPPGEVATCIRCVAIGPRNTRKVPGPRVAGSLGTWEMIDGEPWAVFDTETD